MPTVDLNCDLGEGAGHDTELMPLVTSANIACGTHAGNSEMMAQAVELAKANGVAIGAHPGFPDRENFGRIERVIAPAEASRIVLTQIESLSEIAGPALRHVKLHGALYNQVSRDARLAESLAKELARTWPHLVVFALAGSVFSDVARAHGLRVAEEVFADRTYQRDGSLTPRSQPGAMITDPETAVAQVLRMVQESRVRATDGADVQVRADTICVHGDGAHAVAFARRLNTELKKAGIRLQAVSEVGSAKS